MNDNIFIKVRDRQFGPIPVQEFKNLIRQGSIGKDDLVWNEENDEWISAAGLPDLQKLFFPINGTSPRGNPASQKGSPSGNGMMGTGPKRRMIAVASGKGGVGKSVLTTSMGACLASSGRKTVLVDTDFGGSNLHTMLGMLQPRYTFFEYYISEKDNLEDIVLPTPVDHLGLISGTCGTLGLANPTYQKKRSLMQDLKKLDAEYILLDLAAGATIDVMDFFLLSDEKIVIATPEPTSLYETFGFLKVCLLYQLYRNLKAFPAIVDILKNKEFSRPGKSAVTIHQMLKKAAEIDSKAAAIFRSTLDAFQPKLILNMVRTKHHVKEGIALQTAVSEILAVRLEYLGFVTYDPQVSEAVMNRKPFLLHAPKSRASQDLAALVRARLLGVTGIKAMVERRRGGNRIGNIAKKYPTNDLLQDAPICSVHCPYWNDCEFQMGGHPCRVRHMEPVLREMNGKVAL